MRDDALTAWLTLIRAPGVGPATLRQWLRQAGDIHGALALARRQVRDARTRAWLDTPDARHLEADKHWLAQTGHRLLCCTDLDFPPQLDTIAAAPAALFVDGDAGCLLRPQVAIVGARGASASGLANARLFARALAASGLVVTSGLAEGVDGAAHAATLDATGTTVAVMGTGPDRIYPRRHRDLAACIAENGALVSEFTPGTGPRAEHFPRRNRLIAGLSLGTLVIEAGTRSGSLITARLASEQGREVFALPGSIHQPLARGCHRLIRDGAHLVESVDEVLEALRPLALALGAELAQRLEAADGAGADQAPGPPVDPDYRRLLEALGHGEPMALDTLSQRSGLAPKALSSMLLMLELEGRVASQPGGRYLRTT